MLIRSMFGRSRPSLASQVTGDSVLPFVIVGLRGIIMSAIWGHVESVMNNRNILRAWC